MSQPSSEPNEHPGEIRKGHLRTVQTGDPFPEPETVDIAPDSMGGLDAEAMFRSAEALDQVDTTEPESPDTAAPMSNAPASADDLTGYELPYADGSTTPAERPQHRRPRLRRPKQDPQLTAAIAATTTDIWAAHRNLPEPDQPEPQASEPHHPQRGPRRRLSRGLVIGAFVAVILSVGATVALAGGGSSHPAADHRAQPSAAAPDRSATSTTSTVAGLSIDRSLLEQHVAERATQRRLTAERAAKARRAAELKAKKAKAAKKATAAKKAAAIKKASAIKKAATAKKAAAAEQTPPVADAASATAQSGSSADSSPAASPATQSTPQSSTTSSSSSATTHSGPTGLGGSTSNNCSPTCR
jgi:hypothetical protein